MQKCHIQQVIFDVNSLYLRGDMPVKIPPHPLAGQKRRLLPVSLKNEFAQVTDL